MHVILARPRGFCAGVVRAIQIVERALKFYGPPVYVLHEIVHNRQVIENLSARGVRFVEELAAIPARAPTIFSAHGVSQAIVLEAEAQCLRTINATCPLVARVHVQAQRQSRRGKKIIIIGHHGHPEVEGTRGRVDGPVHVLSTVEEVHALRIQRAGQLAYVTQTTLSIEDTREVITALKRRFPSIQGPELNDICYATQSRQDAVRRLAEEIEILLVVGSSNSSNSNRLRETGERSGLSAYLIEDGNEINPAWLQGKERIGVTAGASAPEILVAGVLRRLQEMFPLDVLEMEAQPETRHFSAPRNLDPQNAESDE